MVALVKLAYRYRGVFEIDGSEVAVGEIGVGEVECRAGLRGQGGVGKVHVGEVRPGEVSRAVKDDAGKSAGLVVGRGGDLAQRQPRRHWEDAPRDVRPGQVRSGQVGGDQRNGPCRRW